MLDARRCHYHAGKSASRGTRVAAQVRHARRGATILNIHRTGVLSRHSSDISISTSRIYFIMSAWLPGYLNSTSFSRRVSSFGRPRRLYNDHDGYIYNSWLRVYSALCTSRPPPRARARPPPLGREPPGRRSHQTQPSGSANRGFKPRTGDITQARGGGAPPRRRGAPPPAMRQRSLLRVRISQTSSAPCNEPRASPPPRPLSLVACPPMAALSGLSTDLGIPPSEVAPQRASSKRAQPD